MPCIHWNACIHARSGEQPEEIDLQFAALPALALSQVAKVLPELALADDLDSRLRALGASTERTKVGMGPGGWIEGTFAGSGKHIFLLIAHMDTVYPTGILATEPYRQNGNKLQGPGIADDKGGIAVILHLLSILRDAGWKDCARLTLLFNPDEAIGDIGSGATIAALGETHDVVLSFEPSVAKAVAKGIPGAQLK